MVVLKEARRRKVRNKAHFEKKWKHRLALKILLQCVSCFKPMGNKGVSFDLNVEKKVLLKKISHFGFGDLRTY